MVVNATKGEFETGFELGGQTREHAILARSLGELKFTWGLNQDVGLEKKPYKQIFWRIHHWALIVRSQKNYGGKIKKR